MYNRKVNLNNSFKNNGKSGKKVYIEDGYIKKEKDKNFKNMIKILTKIKFDNFFIPKACDLNNGYYKYEIIKGLTFQDIVVVSDDLIKSALKCILKIQKQKKFCKVLVHGDFSPVNVVLNTDNQVIGVLDWENCHYGTKYEDIAFICWLWVNFGCPDYNNYFYIEKLKKVFRFLNYNKKQVKKISRYINVKINFEKCKNYKNIDLLNWYDYCKRWIKENWKYTYESK